MSIKNKIKVLIVDDSKAFREMIANKIMQDDGIEVVGTAFDANSARNGIINLSPDVVTLDVEMPNKSGIEFLKEFLPTHPIPVVVVSAVAENVFDALSSGAVDFVTKPGSRNVESFFQELIVKIKIASISRVDKQKNSIANKSEIQYRSPKKLVVAIGASTGGTEAISTILKNLPKDMPGILVVLHMPPVFTKMYSERLNKESALTVKEAVDGDMVIKGRVLIAPGDYHMKLVKKKEIYCVECFKGENVNGHCPSVDVLFNSVAGIAGRNSIGIILTGMGKDGSEGLLNMKKAGAYTIGQDRESSIVYGMPMAANNIGAVSKQLSLSEISKEILRCTEAIN